MIIKPKMRTTAAVAVSSLLLAACFGNSAQQYLAAAKEDLAKNEGNAAVIQLKNALQKDPNLAEARFLLGRTLLAGGDAVGAGIELQKARELGHDNDALLPLQAKAMLMTGPADKVIAEYSGKVAKPDEAQSELQTVLAIAYRSAGKNDQAFTAIEEALRADPANIAAQIFKVRLQIGTRGVAGTIDAMDKIIAAAPTNSEAWQLKGDILQVEGKPDESLAAYKEAVARDKNNLAAQGLTVWHLIMKKDLPAAEAQLKELRAVFPNHPQTKFLTAMIALDKGDIKTATELSQELMKLSPDNISTLQLDGAVALRKNALTRAEKSLSRALQIAPDNKRIRLLLAQTLLRRGDAAKAVKVLQPVVDAADASWESTVLMAQALLVSGDVDRAGTYFAKAAKLDPTDARSRTALALALVDKGRVNEGLEALRSIASADPGNTADLALINVQLKKKDFNGALASIVQLEKKQPDQPGGPYLRGQTQLMIGDRQKARLAFDEAVKMDAKYFPAAAAIAAIDVSDGQLDQARQRFAGLMAADPADNRPVLALVEVMTRQGASSDEITGILNKFIKNNPTAVGPRVKLLGIQIESKKYKAAVAGAQQAIGLIQDNTDLLEMLAQAQYLSGDVNQALASYKQIAALMPNSPLPYVNMASVHLLQKDTAAATQDLKHALSIMPDHFPAHRMLIDLEIAAGRQANALAMVRALEKRPTIAVQALLLEGDMYAAKKQWPEASRAYRNGLDKQLAPGTAIKLHRALLAAGSDVEAQNMAAQWLKTHPDEPSFLYYLGDIAMAKEDFAQARQRYTGVLKTAPDNPLALNNLAWLLAREKNPEALNYALKANKASPKTPAFLDTLAEVYVAVGEMPKAIEAQLKAVSLAPDSPVFRLRLAKYYVLANEKDKAREQLSRLSGLGDKFSRQPEVKAMLESL